MADNMSNGWAQVAMRTVRILWRLLTNPLLCLYFIIVICVAGALGAWIPLAQISMGNKVLTLLGVHRSLATYVIGIVVTAFADCIVRRREEPTFTLFLLGATLASTALAITVLLVDNGWVNTFSRVGTGLAAMVWLMVHDADEELTPGNTYSTLGGEQVQ